MLAERDTRAARHEATRARILDAAWDLARREGLGGISLRELARMVGMRAPSLYTYFDSKNALYDAMYAQSLTQLGEVISARKEGATPRESLRNRMRIFIAHNAADPVRYQLVMERPVPGFVPSEESFAVGLNTFAGTRADLEAAGVRSERAVDLFRAINNGLVGQQVANEPGGDRWTRLADEALDMFLAYWAKEDKTARKKRGTR